jgi:glucose/arabinose dehydrogenase
MNPPLPTHSRNRRLERQPRHKIELPKTGWGRFPVVWRWGQVIRAGGLALACLAAGLLSATAQPYGLESRPPLGPLLNDTLPEVAPVVGTNWTVVPAFPNLVFTNALGITFVPGTNLLCVWEREGRVWTFENNSNVTTKKLVLDISNQCQGWDDSGLLNLAFHPGFTTNGYVFLYYTWVTPGTVVGDPNTRPSHYVVGKYHDRLSRFTIGPDGTSSLATETVFIDQTGDDTWHNGSGMFFHPTNGFLYYADGDDANSANTQIITNKLFSGVFRIDVDMWGGAISHPPPRQPALGTTAHYYIPNDNPFVGQSNVLEEFFCLGLRSPHRMTIDPPTGRIYIGDVGEGSREEIDRMEPDEAGLNFQWSRIEGLNGDLTPRYVGINKRPIMDYPHTDGQAVIGGHVYRGSEFANELGGRYIFGDNVSRTIWVLD